MRSEQHKAAMLHCATMVEACRPVSGALDRAIILSFSGG